jgi:hypothetical protein
VRSSINSIILLLAIIGLTIPIMNVEASGFTVCNEETGAGCDERAKYPETYCIAVEQDPFCENVDICDDEGEVTSEDDFCTGDAVRSVPGEGCPEGYHTFEGDETGQCYSNDLPCSENDYKILQETPNYPGEYYCDNLKPKDESRILEYPDKNN